VAFSYERGTRPAPKGGGNWIARVIIVLFAINTRRVAVHALLQRGWGSVIKGGGGRLSKGARVGYCQRTQQSPRHPSLSDSASTVDCGGAVHAAHALHSTRDSVWSLTLPRDDRLYIVQGLEFRTMLSVGPDRSEAILFDAVHPLSQRGGEAPFIPQ